MIKKNKIKIMENSNSNGGDPAGRVVIDPDFMNRESVEKLVF